METQKRLKLNEPHVVHETIDGETILLHLRTGLYYSMEGSGSVIWDALEKTGDRHAILDIMCEAGKEQEAVIRETVGQFFQKLLDENLLVEDGASGTQDADMDRPDLIEGLRLAAKSFAAPVINKYADMQDLLLLDPIHDVGEVGWPEPKDDQ